MIKERKNKISNIKFGRKTGLTNKKIHNALLKNWDRININEPVEVIDNVERYGISSFRYNKAVYYLSFEQLRILICFMQTKNQGVTDEQLSNIAKLKLLILDNSIDSIEKLLEEFILKDIDIKKDL